MVRLSREIATSRSLVVGSDARCRRLHDRVREAVGGVTADDLESLLGDYRSPDARDLGDDVERLSGDCIVSAMTVQSIVAEPESRRVRLSVGHSPAGLGPYVSVPWSWDGAVGEVPFEGVPGAATGRTHRGDALTDAQRATARAYAEAAHAHLLGVAPAALRPRFEDLVRRAPRDPGFRTLAALFALVTDDFTAARDHLRAGYRSTNAAPPLAKGCSSQQNIPLRDFSQSRCVVESAGRGRWGAR